MKYFIHSAVEYVNKQIPKKHSRNGRMQFVVPELSPLATFQLADRLGDLCLKQDISLNFNVAQELSRNWNQEDQKRLKNLPFSHASETSLTALRNSVNTQETEMLFLVGAAYVKDRASLEDFHQCNDELLWKIEMKKCFNSWLKEFLEEHQINFEKDELKSLNDILILLYRRSDLVTISNFLEKFIPSYECNTIKKIQKELLQQLPNFFGIPNLASITKNFGTYLRNAESFINYESYKEYNYRKTALKKLGIFRSSQEILPEDVYYPYYTSQEQFLDDLEEFITNNSPEKREKLIHCDFVQISDKILKSSSTSKPKPEKESLKKVSGYPAEAILTAIWNAFKNVHKDEDETAQKITLVGEIFQHDFNENDDAIDCLCHILGGIDSLLKERLLQSPNESDLKFEIESRLLRDFSNEATDSEDYVSDFDDDDSSDSNKIKLHRAPNSEPYFKFMVKMTLEGQKEKKYHYAIRLPNLHPFRLADSLLAKANECLDSTMEYYVPIFHLTYFHELLIAKDDEEIGRVLLHSLTVNQAAECPFMENLYTQEWQNSNLETASVERLKKLAYQYREFISTANQQGIYSALFKESKSKLLFDAYYDATKMFLKKKQPKLAAMLMRAFLVIEQKKGRITSWCTSPYERAGIITILHPSVLEMLQARVIFLLDAFTKCVNQELQNSHKSSFHENTWNYYVDMATIQMPLSGLLINENKNLSVNVFGKGLIHRIGDITPDNFSMSTRLMVRYDSIEDESIEDSEIFRVSRDSRLLCRFLKDYCKIHPHAMDGLSLTIYRNEDVQPVLAALDEFLKWLEKNDILTEKRHQKYTLNLNFLSRSADSVSISNWLKQWQERWENSELEESLKHYRFCKLYVSHQLVSSNDGNSNFVKILKNLDCDIAVLYHFIQEDTNGTDFMPAAPFDTTNNILKFPILEKSYCATDSPDSQWKREQIISNRQFSVCSSHTELLAFLKNPGTDINKNHVILGKGDFEPWEKVINATHNSAEWVICIDANMDEKLLSDSQTDGMKRELIGFGSGIGSHGENNYTISTQKHNFTTLKTLLQDSFNNSTYNRGTDEENEKIVDAMIKNARSLAGLSVIRALGPSFYIHDFMAYCFMQMILPMKLGQYLCNQIFSIDAYRHWFDMADESSDSHQRPDLLWLRAKIQSDNTFDIDVRLIECKMTGSFDSAVENAEEQIKNGLKLLTKAFQPRKDCKDSNLAPDQRYWYLQLHRLITSRIAIQEDEKEQFLTALEKLSDGNFTINWGAGIFVFDTQSEDSQLNHYSDFLTDCEKCPTGTCYSIGYRFIRNICTGKQSSPILAWDKNLSLGPQKEDVSPVSSRYNASEMEDEPETELEDETWIEESEDEKLKNPVAESVITNSQPSEESPQETLSGKLAVDVIPTSIPDRILLGRTQSKNPVYWEFGHKDLNNRHLLIFGNSGMGKTYAIQCILTELGKMGQNSLIIDYTDGFLENQLQPLTNEILVPKQHFIRLNPLPINPFFRIKQMLGGTLVEDDDSQVAKRVAAIFDTVYNLGDQQFSILHDAIEETLQQKKDKTTFQDVLKTLQSSSKKSHIPKSSAMTIYSKLKTFLKNNYFAALEDGNGWDSIFNDTDSRCHVFQLSSIDSVYSRILTEFILWDLYAYAKQNSTEATPKIVVLDEIQNLDHKEDAPVSKYLREGRKFGLCLISATQTLSNLKKDARARLFQSAHTLFFRPADPELAEYAEIIYMQSNKESKSYWQQQLTKLGKGECFSLGLSLNEGSGKLESRVQKIKITALEERNF